MLSARVRSRLGVLARHGKIESASAPGPDGASRRAGHLPWRRRLLLLPVALLVAAAGFGAFAAASGATATCTPPAGLTPIYWTGATSSDWSTETNWSLTDGGPSAGRLPGSSEFVCMSSSPTTSTVNLSSGTTSVVGGISFPVHGAVQPSLTVAGTLTVGNGTVDDASSIDQLTVAGTLGPASGVTLAATNLTLTGRLEGPGTVTVSGPTSLGAAVLGFNHEPSVAAHLVLQGASTLPANTTLDVYGSSVLENEGTLTLADGSDINGGSDNTDQVINDPGATISYTASASGKSASVGTLAVNRGTVSVGAGTLNFGAFAVGVSDSGAFRAALGATLNLYGTRTEAAGATLAGAGTITVQGTLTVTAASNLGTVGTFELNDGLLIVDSGVSATTADLTLTGSRLEGPGTLTVSGPTSFGASVLGFNGEPSVAAHLVLQGASTLPASTTLDVYGSSVLENEGTLTLADGSDINGGADSTDQVINDAGATISYTASASGKSASVSTPTTNNGTVIASLGTLSLPLLTNLSSGGTLTGGSYAAAGGTISLPHAVISNDATIVLGANPSAFTVSGSGNALTGLGTNAGSLDLKQSLTLTGSLKNTGTVTVENSSTLTATTYTQTAGTTTVVGGSTLESGTGTSNVAIDGGTLAGTGTVAGDVLGSGDVKPSGAVTGPMSVTGTYNASMGTLTIPVRGTTNPGTDFGQLSVTGAATLGGTLTMQTALGFTPPVGTKYTILKAGSVSGTFQTVKGTLIGSTEKYVISYTSTSVVAKVVPVPDVTGISPNAGPTAGGTSVTISGSGFTGATAVLFGNTAATKFTVNGDTQVTATAPAESAETVDVTVTTPNGTSQTSPADRYSYDAPPTLSSISPTAGPTKGAQKVTLTGTNFTLGATVEFGTSQVSSVALVSSTKLTASTPSHAVGAVAVTVTTPGGTTGSINYRYDPQPTVTSVAPNTGTTAGGNKVTINGSGFLFGATVKFGSSKASSTLVSGTQMTATAPAEAAGSVNVTVTTPGGTSASTAKDLYAYGAPTVSSFAPISAITGKTVTITGTAFVPGVTVSFGSLGSPAVTVSSGTKLTAVVPNGASTGKVSVSDNQGTGTSPTKFTVTLSITGFMPGSGPAGTLVTINGVGFNSKSRVKFNGLAASSVTFVSPTELQAKVPSGATSGPITVTNTTTPTGTVTSPSGYSVTASAAKAKGDRTRARPLARHRSARHKASPTLGQGGGPRSSEAAKSPSLGR